jgi:vacuolar-type H+-ATPase subunit H
MDSFSEQQNGEQGFEEDALRAVMAIELAAQTTIRNAEIEAQRIIEVAKEQAQQVKTAEIAKWQRENEEKLELYRQEIKAQVHAIRSQAIVLAERWLDKANKNTQRAVDYALQTIIFRDSVG